MPRAFLDPKDIQSTPVGLRAPQKGRRWEHVDALGEFLPVVPNKLETGMTTRLEKERGIISLKYEDGVRKDIVLAEERITDTKPIDTEVKDGFGTIDSPSSGTLGDGDGATRAAVDVGGQLAGRPERVVPR